MERLCAAEDEIAHVIGYIALDDNFVDAGVLDALAYGCACCESR